MAKSTENLPVQYYIQQLSQSATETEPREDANEFSLLLDESGTNILISTYQRLWMILTDLAYRSESQTSKEHFASNYFFETHSIPGHPDVFLRGQVIENKKLAWVLEQTVEEPTFAGRVGLIFGARGRSTATVLKERHALQLIDLDLVKSTRPSFGPWNIFRPRADEMFASLVPDPSQVARVHEWFEEAEQVVKVPERSLRETTQWLASVNQEIAKERETTLAQAVSQNDEFMRLFASLAHTKLGA